VVVDFDFETLALCVTAVHAKEHLRPVLCFGAAATRIDIEEAIRVIRFAGEHALEFDFGERGICAIDIALNALECCFVALAFGKLEEFRRTLRVARQTIDGFDDAIKCTFFFAEFACAVGVIPNIRVFEFGVDFL
jgi:hypothetical protein